MAKYACRAKLVGIGFGASTKTFAAGCEARNATMGGGLGLPGPLAAAARMNSRNSSPVLVGNPLCEWAMMSEWTCSAKWKRTAMPCGLAPMGSVSATHGVPADNENRTAIGVDGR